MSNPAEGFLGGLLVMVFIACMYVTRIVRCFEPRSSEAKPRLYGITVLQSFVYFQTYENDTTPLKCLVCPSHPVSILSL